MKCKWPECSEEAAEGADYCVVKHEKATESQRQADETGRAVYWRGEQFIPKGSVTAAEAPDPRAPPPGTRVYKVITQRDAFFASKFNPETLEKLLNQHARDGWRVVSMTATDVGSFFGSFWAKGGGATRQELVVLLERTA
jgi:hypothetical protein